MHVWFYVTYYLSDKDSRDLQSHHSISFSVHLKPPAHVYNLLVISPILL